MSGIIVKDSMSVQPTIFKARESRRVICPERDNSMKVSVHLLHNHGTGLGYVVNYPENDEILYILEGEGEIVDGDRRLPFKPGWIVFIPAKSSYQIHKRTDLKMLAILAPPRYRDQWKDRTDLVQLEPEEQ